MIRKIKNKGNTQPQKYSVYNLLKVMALVQCYLTIENVYIGAMIMQIHKYNKIDVKV